MTRFHSWERTFSWRIRTQCCITSFSLLFIDYLLFMQYCLINVQNFPLYQFEASIDFFSLFMGTEIYLRRCSECSSNRLQHKYQQCHLSGLPAKSYSALNILISSLSVMQLLLLIFLLREIFPHSLIPDLGQDDAQFGIGGLLQGI